jgi:HD-GYP domain-containing protein (c-di-GMP phosphodiesterase class II)/HAMP domain-containing protein
VRPVSLGSKFVLALVVCALVPLVVFSTVNYLRTSAGLTAIQDRLVATSTAAVVDGVAQQQASGIAPFTVSADFARSVSSGDRRALSAAAQHILESRNLLQVDVRAADGSLLARATILPSPRRLGVGSSGYAFQSSFGRPWVISSVPVTASGHGGRQIGTVVAAGQLGDDVLQAAAQRAGTPASVYVNGLLAASSVDGAERVDQLSVAMDRHGVGDRANYFSSLRDTRGRPVAAVAVAVPVGAFAAIRASMRTTSQLALALALVAALLAALFLARRVIRPLRKLSSAAEAISGGELRQQLPVRGEDEVAVMARSFNRMSERIADTVGELAGQIQTLSRALADLSLVGETLAQSADASTELAVVAQRVRTMTGSDFCGIHLLEEARLGEGIYAGTVNGSMLAVEELVRWTNEADLVATTTTLAQDDRLSALAARGATGISSVMVVPIVHQGRAVGAISVGCARQHQYSPSTAALLSTVASQVATALRHAQTFKDLEASYMQTVVALAAALEAKDSYTADHADTIARLALAVGRELSLSEPELRRVEYAALLHDVGKIAISAEILDKPGPLSPEERAVVDRHTLIGEQIVARIDYLRPLAPLVRAAHERWDGNGYPDRIAGDAIPLESRIAFVCDALHAMTSDRPYRARLSDEEALRELSANAGSQFDPAVVAALLRVWPQSDGGSSRAAVAQQIMRPGASN